MRNPHLASRWLLTITLLLSSMTAAWAQTARVILPTVDVCSGGDVYVPVTVDPVDILTSMDLTFTYDDTVLSVVAVHQAPLLSSFTMTSDITTSGQVDILLTETATTGTGTVAWVEFIVTGAGGSSSPLTWSTSDLNGGAVTSDEVDGQVNVVSLPQSALSPPDDATRMPFGTVTVPIIGTPADGLGLDIVFEFDESVLQFDVASTTPISSDSDLLFNVTAPGQLTLAMFGTSALTGTGSILDIDFTVLGAAGDFSPLILTRVDINEDEITSCTDDGTFRVCNPIADDDTTCDGVDDDCDGALDEDYVVVNCGTGECAASSTCVDGVETTCIAALTAVDGQACGNGSATDCTNPDSCLSGVCEPNDQASGTACGDPSNTECTNPDTCDGAGACQTNHEPSGAPCGDQGVECVVNDSCDGSGGCTDNGSAPAGTECDDGLFCTTDTTCSSGICSGTVEGSLAPDSELSSVSLIGDTAGDCSANDCVIDVDDDPDAPDGNFAAAVSNNVDTVMILSFPTPAGLPTVGPGLQEFRAQVRQFNTAQTGIPLARIELWENGSLVRAGADETVVGSGQIVSFTWDAAELGTADGSLVEIQVVGTRVGGSPSIRNAVDIGAVKWNLVALDPAGGQATDCSAAGDQCNVGVCNEATDSCEPQPANEGLTCDDGLACNVDETCQAGLCAGGAPLDCSAAGDQCNVGVCNEATNSCEPQFANEGLACDDGLACNVDETCQSGSCAGGAPLDCSAAGDQCSVGVCNEATDSCEPQFANEGLACDDGLACNVDETCQAGSCGGGGPLDCSAAGDQCNVGVCNEATDSCEPQPANEGLTCDDGLACNVDETCQAGLCAGGATLDCSAAGDQCNVGVCNEATGDCEPRPENEGLACDDGFACTVAETCQSGSCAGGAPVDCSAAGDECNTASCDPGGTEGNCDVLTPVAPPAEVDDTVFADKNGTDALLSWTDEIDPGPFRVYRGQQDAGQPFVYNHVCLNGPFATPNAVDADVPVTNRVFYYLVNREACGRASLGTASNGTSRPNDNPCP